MQEKQTATQAAATAADQHDVRELSVDEMNTVAGGLVVLIDGMRTRSGAATTGIILSE